MQWELEGLFRPPESKKNRFDHGEFFFRLSEPSGIRVEITSLPRTDGHDMKRGKDGVWLRAPIDEHAVCFSVASSFMQELCTFADKKEDPQLVLRPGETEVEYSITSAGTEGTSRESQGSMPLVWGSANRYPIYISLDPHKILAVLKKSTDEYVQFIMPAHPGSGFEYYELNPVYLNTNPRFFAVISQMLRAGETDRLGDLLRSRDECLAERQASG